MKKTYIAPSVEVIEVNVANIMAASVINIYEQEVDTSNLDVQQGRENSFGSIWDQGW